MITEFIVYLVGCIVAFIVGSIFVRLVDSRMPLDWEDKNRMLMPAIASWVYVIIVIFLIIRLYIDKRK